MTDQLIAEILDALADPVQAAAIAQRLGPHLAAQVDCWFDTKEAAKYLGLTPNALHKLTARRAIPFEQDVAGGKCWFKRSQLDEWRAGGGSHRSAA